MKKKSTKKKINKDMFKLSIISKHKTKAEAKEPDIECCCFGCDKLITKGSKRFWSKPHIEEKFAPKNHPHDSMIICEDCYKKGL